MAGFALLVSLMALSVALGVAAQSLVLGRATARAGARPTNPEALPEDVQGLREEVAALRLDSGDALRHVAMVRYDAFGDMGGKLSWSLALLDDHANGVVVTSIHGRSDGRTYAKSVNGGQCDQPLSPEESDAIGHARGDA